MKELVVMGITILIGVVLSLDTDTQPLKPTTPTSFTFSIKIIFALFCAIVVALAFTFFGNVTNLFHDIKRKEEENQKKEDDARISLEKLRSKWTQKIIDKISTNDEDSCCPIFDCIRDSQGKLEWGSVLDAGTGIHSLEWMISLKTSRWTAVTGDPKRENELREMFGSEMRPQDKLVTGNWKDPKFLGDEKYDVVLADYLLGSLDGYAPYYQDKLFERIKKHVGKRLYITGAEPLPDNTNNERGKLIIEIAKARDSCILLAGERPYREYPLDWVLRNMKHCGYKIINVAFFETTHTKDFVETQIKVAESKLHKIKSYRVQQSMESYLSTLRARVRMSRWPATFSTDYVVAVEPIESKTNIVHSNPLVDEKMSKYSSPVQEQNQIFPRDEYDSSSSSSSESESEEEVHDLVSKDE